MLAPIQTQFTTFWKKQSNAQRITLIALIITALVLIPVLLTWANTPSYVTAYSGLSETDAAQIVAQLDTSGIAYKLKNSGTITVPSDQVYNVRLKMASAGLPKSSTVGYELFSGNTLGMTEFTQKIDYQRALEGELARTISSLDAVDTVSVHVVTPDKTLLASDQPTTTASVTIKTKSNQNLSAANVRAITHLVASSVQGLQPENVVVIDSNGNMLAGGGSSLDTAVSQTDNQRAAEAAAATDVRKRVQSMLDSALGPNKSIVQASVAMDWTQKEVTSSTFNPTPAAIRSSQKVNESYNTNGIPAGGIPGASSNLPTPVPLKTGVPSSPMIYNRSEETMNYEISQVQSKEVVAPGQISKVSVSVMVDNITDAKLLDTIKSAVTAASGIDTARGDTVVVSSYVFDHTALAAQQAADAKSSQMDQYIQYGITAGAVLLLLALVFYFTRLFKDLRNSSRESWKPILKPVGEMTPLAGSMGMGNGQLPAGIPASLHAGLSNVMSGRSSMDISLPGKIDDDVLVDITPRHAPSPEDEQRSKIITKLAEENPATVAEIIQIWLTEDNKRNG